jgi:hypothetical protein
MNKWLILGATGLITFAFAYTIPFTIKNPITSNLVISGILGCGIIGGLYAFNKVGKMKNKPETMKIGNQQMTPIP